MLRKIKEESLMKIAVQVGASLGLGLTVAIGIPASIFCIAMFIAYHLQ